MNRRTARSAIRFLAGLAVLLSAAAPANEFHPAFPLLDKQGQPVIESTRPLSTMQTCGACHDTGFIASSSDHADAGATQLGASDGAHAWEAGPGFFGGWDPLRYATALDSNGEFDPELWLRQSGGRHVGGGPVSEWVEMDCLLCHSDLTNNLLRREALETGNFQWANSVRLTQKDILQNRDGQWVWNPALFLADGSLFDGVLDIRKPTDRNCAQCHGQAGIDIEIPLMVDPDPANRIMTDRTGQIISPQKVSLSAMNIAGKDELDHPFDVHADRVVGCVNCHYSLNNPVYFQQREESRPAHLDFDPRRLSIAEYLQRPLHQFAKGKSTFGLAAEGSENSLRRCESCHDAGNVHQWLPYRERHFTALACESCHVPELFGPAVQSIDWTLVDPTGEPRWTYREVEGDPATADSLVNGYLPLLLARENRHGEMQLAPFNMVSSWYWLEGEPAKPVSRERLVQALYVNGEPRHALLDALDSDRDGLLAQEEMRLDTAAKADAVRQMLVSSGLADVRMASELTPWSINHNVVNGRWATRQCDTCHDRDSILAAPFTLSDQVPGGQVPELADAAVRYAGIGLVGSLHGRDDGSLAYIPAPAASGFYIIGLNSVGWIDRLGLLMFFGIIAAVSVHALARFYFNRRRSGAAAEPERKPVYMYVRYERLWHWLQASAILLLLATGLIIHKPHFFGMFSFAYVVQVHNVLGFILLINAALALFYNLASGEIRQYLPEPRGFVGRSIAQALYYSRGIFAGEPHPLEKTPEKKLNPLQQITYLAILNILLPAQVITGVLIWGLQKWPVLATSLGGLPLLAPLHTLVAWAFAAFIVMHVYLTTAAGETPGAGIKSMVSGWEEVEQHASSANSTKES
jgi:thiosulfate reductase cytochrome b subunit